MLFTMVKNGVVAAAALSEKLPPFDTAFRIFFCWCTLYRYICLRMCACEKEDELTRRKKSDKDEEEK